MGILSQKFKCEIGLHDWSKWSDPIQVEETCIEHKIKHEIQKRSCQGCRKIEVRKIGG